jgi:hypothetical protein
VRESTICWTQAQTACGSRSITSCTKSSGVFDLRFGRESVLAGKSFHDDLCADRNRRSEDVPVVRVRELKGCDQWLVVVNVAWLLVCANQRAEQFQGAACSSPNPPASSCNRSHAVMGPVQLSALQLSGLKIPRLD